MTTETLNQHIEITPGISGGKPRIAGHRITVENIVIWHERLGKSADEIASDYDITLANVYAALAYYFDHRHEIDQSLEESRTFVNTLRQKSSSKLPKKMQKWNTYKGYKEVMANSDPLVADPSTEIIFEVSEDEVDGGYSASALGYGIHTQGEDWNDLKAMVQDAVLCHFDDTMPRPKLIRLHFVRDEVLLV